MKRATISVLFLSLLVFAGCGKKTQVKRPVPVRSSFQLAEAHYLAGDYANAIPAYESHLRSADQANRETALFHLALSYALAGESVQDLSRAQALLTQLIKEYPSGETAHEARLLSRDLALMREFQTMRVEEQQRLEQLSADVAKLMQRVAELEKHRESDSSDPLRKASLMMREGSFQEAANIYRDYLASQENLPHKDEAAFRLAMIHLSPENGLRDVRAALGLLDRIGRDWPEGPFAPQSRYLLSMHREVTRLRTQVENQQAQMKQLNDELKALKEIDLKKR